MRRPARQPCPGKAAGPELAAEIQAFVKTRVAPYQHPRKVDFIAALPLTASGKIVRRTLHERQAVNLFSSVARTEGAQNIDLARV